jgi:hypothetical protein
MKNKESADRFVRASSELSLAMFDLVSCRRSRKVNFVFRDQDLERQDGHRWKIEMTCEQCCASCLLVAALV